MYINCRTPVCIVCVLFVTSVYRCEAVGSCDAWIMSTSPSRMTLSKSKECSKRQFTPWLIQFQSVTTSRNNLGFFCIVNDQFYKYFRSGWKILRIFWGKYHPHYQYHPPNNLLKMTKVRLVRGRKMNLPGGLVMAFWVDDFPFPVWWDMLETPGGKTN